jgi:hypothetical protein
VFVDGSELDRYFETPEGIIWVTGLIRIQDATLFLQHLPIYPATGARLRIGVPQMAQILRSLKKEGIDQGLSAYPVEAARMRLGRPARMIRINRRLG